MKFIYVLLVAFMISPASADEMFCMYPDNDTRELEQVNSCGPINNGLLTVDPSLMTKMMWSKYGMQCIYINYPKDKGWFYINQNGLGRGSPFSHDNDCTPYQAGVAIGLVNGYVVYFNQVMDVVKTTEYTWASNFYKGYSKVCIGELTKEYDRYGEHYQLKGGQCGFIDREFNVVVQVAYPHESTPVPESL
ncbi:hypothetical protein BST95_02625 [Halioglobus japonicus]|uniref:Uncharacterized protein n=1 Tax=Halioglobus japonicus TaxID=930805 RepID=A0AAP8MB08_9GAMM|nr:hypothetical protein [Halioglobus japonicus]AQA17281.1 hypothetical protein BST95_02625 [Halioglobus japonicus]PLW84506.1 hypothetical protein C0029_18825 [Halioglobus japonicus]GHD24516.1 hypothetical protein GCM10007052_38140 [Halioglobus japonicus]